jgi:hypothetical protein
MFRLVAGIDPTGFPGTEVWIFAPAELLCALAVKKVILFSKLLQKTNKNR